MRKLIPAAVILCVALGCIALYSAQTVSVSKKHTYVLRAWRIDGDEQDQYLWALDERQFEERQFPEVSPGTLYRSLDSLPFRTKVAGLPAGATIFMQWNLGGALRGDQSSYVTRVRGLEGLQDFAIFCKSKNLTLDLGGVGD